jgi:hypothetical protein
MDEHIVMMVSAYGPALALVSTTGCIAFPRDEQIFMKPDGCFVAPIQ